jgi:SMI1 / KNR4 family (SUKH-1)
MSASDSSSDAEMELVARVRNKLARSPGGAASNRLSQLTTYPPLLSNQLAEEEARLGFSLPPLLRQVYSRLGNGWTGPEYELLSLRQISPMVDQTIPTLYHQFRRTRAKRGGMWAEGLIPFAHWGDLVLSCVDLSDVRTSDDPPVVRYEPNMPEAATYGYLSGAPYRGAGLIPEKDRLSAWLEDWINDEEMFGRPHASQHRG